MTTTPKLPIHFKAPLVFFGLAAFVSLVVATFSMFVWIGGPVKALCTEKTSVSFSVQGGTVDILGITDPLLTSITPAYVLQKAEWFPPMTEKSLYLFEASSFGEGWRFSIPLVSIGIVSLLMFLFLVRRMSRMLRNAIFAAPTLDQEAS